MLRPATHKRTFRCSPGIGCQFLQFRLLLVRVYVQFRSETEGFALVVLACCHKFLHRKNTGDREWFKGLIRALGIMVQISSGKLQYLATQTSSLGPESNLNPGIVVPSCSERGAFVATLDQKTRPMF